jgi:hypothetical protein
MTVFSVNQATQLYVGSFTEKATKTKDSQGVHTATYFEDKNGGVRTDLIKPGHELYSTKVTVAGLNIKANAITITPKNFQAGDQYLVRLTIVDDFGAAAADIKTAAVIATSATASDLVAKIEDALNKAAKRDLEPAYEVKNETSSLTITPKVSFELGKKFTVPQISVQIVDLKNDAKTLEIMGDDTAKRWVSAGPIEGGLAGTGLMRLQALEYFCAGEKGDIYRGASYPNNIPFKSKLAGVGDDTSVTVIHYYEDCSNEAVQKSEKTMVLVGNIAPLSESGE